MLPRNMALTYTADIWREIILALDSQQDLVSLVDSHPSFGQLLEDRALLRKWLNNASAKVKYEFGDIGRPYTYGDWTVDYLLPCYKNGTIRYSIESLLARGCNASVLKDDKVQRCGRTAGYSRWNDVIFPFDLLRVHGWKVCKACLDTLVIDTQDTETMAFLTTFMKVFPSTDHERSRSLHLRTYEHLGQHHTYYKLSDVDEFIQRESSGLFTSFTIWKSGVIAKRGSTSELQISALLHSARGLALPGGPGRTQIALEIARQSIKEYEHRMNQFILMNHPDIRRLGLSVITRQ